MIDRNTARRILGVSPSVPADRIRGAYWALRARLEERAEASRSEVFQAARREELRDLEGVLRVLFGEASSLTPRAGGARTQRWLWGWAVGSTLLALSLSWMQWSRQPAAPIRGENSVIPETAPGSEAGLDGEEERGWLTARANLSGAQIEITAQEDDRPVAAGPADGSRYSLPVGDYTLRVEHPDCPDSWRNEISLGAGEELDLEPRTCESVGLLVVRSNVSGDRLAIDGQEAGATGPEAHVLAPGEHRVRVEKKGYTPWEGLVDLQPAQRLVLRAALTPNGSPERASGAPENPVAAAPIDMAALRDARLGPGVRGWHDTVKRWLLARYDGNLNGRIDTREEVASIPCTEWRSLEQSLDSSGLALPLTRLYGFDGSAWVENALGFDASMRGHAYARMKECGLR